jgi:hypothetical protein
MTACFPRQTPSSVRRGRNHRQRKAAPGKKRRLGSDMTDDSIFTGRVPYAVYGFFASVLCIARCIVYANKGQGLREAHSGENGRDLRRDQLAHCPSGLSRSAFTDRTT